MKTHAWKRTAPLLTLAAGLSLGLAAEPGPVTLKVGDLAPKLQTGRWIQGEPVKEFAQGKAYLVEFWATWCGPCRVSIPHLNELHNKYKDKGLIVIGQDCWERDESQVEPFVKKMGEKMTYRVALDDKAGHPQGRMAETWMAAAGQNGIPSAFLVDTQGRLAWIGHPMELKEEDLAAVLDGTFDLKKAAAAYELRQKNEARLRTVWRDLNRAMREQNWAEAETKLAEAEQLVPEDERDGLGMTRFNLLLGKQEFAAAFELAARLSDANPGNARLQNHLAWQIVADARIEKPDLAVAEKIATRANDAAQGANPDILDTLARVRFMQGKKTEAIALQEKAVQLAEGDQKKNFEEVLASYKKGELPKVD